MAESGGGEQTAGAAPATTGALRSRSGAPHVFISYASADSTVAELICGALEREGVTCWIAPRDVVPGEFYAGAIVHAIDAARVIVLVLSENAATSQHVLREVERASSKRHPVVSFRIDRAPMPADLEYFLNTSHWLDASATGVDRALPKLVDAVHRAVTPASASDPDHAGSPVGAAVPLVPPPSGANKATPPRRPTVVALVAIVTVVLAYVVVDKFWLSKRVVTEHSIAAVVPATPVPVPAATAISEKSIAVLPFTDMSEKRDQEFFADGMTEEVIDLLAKVPGLRVPARTSSFYFKGKSTKIPDIAHELGVAHVLEGSIRRSGNRIRVTAQLVRADNEYHLWSETYDRDLRDVFKVQDEIANAVVQALQIGLMGGPLRREAGGTQNLEAYQLYLKATSAALHNTRASLAAASGYLEQAIKRDPHFGLGWARLGNIVLQQTDGSYLLPKVGYERTRQLAQHALKLSPDLAEAHALLAYVHRTYDWDWARSEAELRAALSSEPTNLLAFQFGGMLANTLGRWDDAMRQLRAVIERDPMSTYARFNLAFALYNAGRYAEAEAEYGKLFDIEPGYSWAHSYLAKTLLADGKPDAALAMAQQEPEEFNRLDVLPIMLQAAGRQSEADAALRALIDKYSDTEAFFVAMTYAYRGDRDLALQWLDRAYTQKDASLVEIVGEPLFKNLAHDPRFKAFLRKMNLPE